MKTKGDRIRELRQARGMTQQELADYCGVSRESVSYWETGSTQNIKNVTYIALLEALGTTAAYLEFGPDQRPKSGRRGKPKSAQGSDNTA